MLSSGVVTILVVLATTGCVLVKGDYFLVCPNVIRSGLDFTCEVSYMGTESVLATVSLTLPGEGVLATQTRSMATGYETFRFNLNEVPDQGSVTVSIEGKVGSRTVFENSTIVQTDKSGNLCLIQLDKPMYKPSDNVRIRIVCIDMDLKPIDAQMDILLKNPKGQLRWHWLRQYSNNGVIHLEYQLIEVPAFGTWTLEVKSDAIPKTTKQFMVQEYVLPKFSVKVAPTSKTLIQGVDNTVTIKVLARTTYETTVYGKVKFIFGHGNDANSIKEFSLRPDREGYHVQTFDLENLSNYRMGQSLVVNVNVTDNSTDKTESADETIVMWYDQRFKVEFLPISDGLFRPGLPFTVYVKTTDMATNQPALVGREIELRVYMGKEYIETPLINNDGIAEQTFDVPDNFASTWGISVSAQFRNLEKSYGYLYASWQVKQYRAQLNTTIDVVLATPQPIQAGSNFAVKVQATGSLRQLAYIVLSRGMIVARDVIPMPQTTKTFLITSNRMMTPEAKVFVYGIVEKDGQKEIIADAVDVKFVGLFSESLTLGFSQSEVRPGDNVDIQLEGPGSAKYYIYAIDESVLLLNTGNDLTQAEVIKGMMGFAAGVTPEYNDVVQPNGRMIGGFMPNPFGNNQEPTSAGELLKNTGLIYLSDAIIEEYEPPPMIMFAMAGAERAQAAEMDGPVPPSVPTSNGVTQVAQPGRTRKNFAETWLWMDGMINPDGSIAFTQQVPDSITTYVATAFSLSDTAGLSITNRSTPLRIFQPVFSILALKYSIVRGEVFELRVAVSNYLDQDARVVVTLEKSDEFDVVEEDEAGVEIRSSKDVVRRPMVTSGMPASESFMIAPKILGQVTIAVSTVAQLSTGEFRDRLERKMLVRPEGFQQRQSKTRSIEFTAQESPQMGTVQLQNTDQIVSGSRRVTVDICGDVMGKALRNLEHMIQQPTGCGEQNMITFVPNIVVYIYLEAVNQLDPKIADRAKKNMNTGYQRELNYMRSDGGFSAFGDSDDASSTWLTAFVIKSFSQASRWVPLEEDMMNKAIGWLMSTQNTNGSFRKVGRVIHEDMMGGAAKDTALTAFVLIALRESDIPQEYVAQVNKAQSYLEGLVRDNNLENTYEKAIVLYALQLSGSSYVDNLLQDISENAEKPWKEDTTEDKDEMRAPAMADMEDRVWDYRKPDVEPTDIEIWSYVLMTHAKRTDMGSGVEIMKWLITQQDEFGAFKSTQDTVLGLQALADYASLLYDKPQTNMRVTVTGRAPSGDMVHTFDVSNDDLLLLQSQVFPMDTTTIEYTAVGSGLAIFNVNWRYNTLKEPIVDTTKKINQTVNTHKTGKNEFLIQGCVTTEDDHLGMVVMEMFPQTGYEIYNRDSLTASLVRADFNDDRIVAYFNDIGYSKCVDFKVRKSNDLAVKHIQPAVISSQVYYQPGITSKQLYTVEEEEVVVDICDVCVKGFCPEKCDINSAPVLRFNVLFVAFICLFVKLILAV